MVLTMQYEGLIVFHDEGFTLFYFEEMEWCTSGHKMQKITSSWRQNDVATRFWSHNDVIIVSRARWDANTFICLTKYILNSQGLL